MVVVTGADAQPAAFRRKFDGVLDQVPKDLLEPRWIGFELHPRRRQFQLQRELLLVDLRLANLDRAAQQFVRVHDLEAELHLAFADASQVEQVVNQPRFQLHIAADHLEGRQNRFRQIFVIERHQGGEHRGEGSPQFVAEHREKAIFREVRTLGFGAGFLGRLVEGRVVEGEGGAAGHFFSERRLGGAASTALIVSPPE